MRQSVMGEFSLFLVTLEGSDCGRCAPQPQSHVGDYSSDMAKLIFNSDVRIGSVLW